MSVFAISASGIRTAFRRQDVIANNFANSTTPSFRSSRADAVDVRGGGADIGSIRVRLQPGPLEIDGGNPFSLAIAGEGFFELQTPDGPRYTRAGTFGLSANQRLVDPSTGFTVRGVNGSPVSIPLGSLTSASPTSSVRFGGNLNGGGAQSFNGSVVQSNVLTDASTGLPATAASLLSNVGASGTISASAVKGGRTINANFTVTPASTLGDFANFLEGAFGIQNSGFSALRTSQAATGLVDSNGDGLTDQIVAGGDLIAAGAQVGDVVQFRSGPGAGLQGSIAGFVGNDTIVLAQPIPASAAQPAVGNQFSVHEAPGVTVAGGRLRIAGNAGTVNDTSSVTASPFGPFTQQVAADGESVRSTVTVFDSLGNPRSLEVSAVLEAQGGVDAASGSPGNQFRVFGESGDSATRGVGAGSLRFSTGGQVISGGATFNLNISNQGAQTTLTVTPEFGGVTGFAGPSSIAATGQDGASVGTLNDFSIGSDGGVTGVFSNGGAQSIGQVRLVRFANPGALIAEGNNMFRASPSSGPPIPGVPGQNLLGQVVGGAIEGSNVDLGSEIIAQVVNKAFAKANIGAVKREDEMLGNLLDILQ